MPANHSITNVLSLICVFQLHVKVMYWPRVGARAGTLKNPEKCLWCREPDRRSNFFSVRLHIVAYITEISLNVTLYNKYLQWNHISYADSFSLNRIYFHIRHTTYTMQYKSMLLGNWETSLNLNLSESFQFNSR